MPFADSSAVEAVSDTASPPLDACAGAAVSNMPSEDGHAVEKVSDTVFGDGGRLGRASL
jgi:hypothetical protein